MGGEGGEGDMSAEAWKDTAEEIWASQTHKRPAYENYTKEKREHPELAAFDHSTKAS